MMVTELYKRNYLPGFDCRMATFRNNLAYYGYNFSNGMMLGLSGCLSFIYSKPEGNRIPYYTILGITDQTLEGLSSVFDSYLIYGNCSFDRSDVLTLLKTNLEKNIVINAAINRPLLNHIRKGNDLKYFVFNSSYTGFHFVTITGLKDDKITFFETDYSKPLEYDVDTFINLWFYDTIHNRASYDSSQACNGKYYTIHPPKFDPHKNKNALLFLIEKVTNNFFTEGKYYHNGVQALHDFFEDITTWRHSADKNCAINSIFYIKILEMNLSGGGFGRRLYSSFLAEVAEIIDDNTLKSIAREFKETSKLWTSFINAISSPETINSLMSGQLDLFESLAEAHSTAIITAETNQFTHLNNWIKLKN
ncbi:MAG: BtrH N-terminal domain-containing protein [Chryseobacterium sp.]|uniref:DUF4872 domain-containing protein n=1 Tax=Chryseobacterium sp. TaxID=1871047 RepID=UPI0025B925B7|nr:DUF4872 domain-containing protein [Chryseobacterium sp.]MCJ7934770.1 BtrH N-terminal domain-containing protein [Chryseobacterium sp.]